MRDQLVPERDALFARVVERGEEIKRRRRFRSIGLVGSTLVLVLVAAIMLPRARDSSRGVTSLRDAKAPERLTLPEQPFIAHPNIDDSVRPTRGNYFFNATTVVEGVVDDFAIYRLKDSPEIPDHVKTQDAGVRAGGYHARWRVRVQRTLKGPEREIVNVTSQGFEEIIENDHRNPYVEGERYRFYLVPSGLGGSFFVASLVEPTSRPVPSPEPGPVVFDEEGDGGAPSTGANE